MLTSVKPGVLSTRRVYLFFGSKARGESGSDSDLDFCIVLPDDAPPSLFRDRSIHKRFWGLQAPVDVVRHLPISTRARPTSSHPYQPPSFAKGSSSVGDQALALSGFIALARMSQR